MCGLAKLTHTWADGIRPYVVAASYVSGMVIAIVAANYVSGFNSFPDLNY
jgi:hypothetical protein